MLCCESTVDERSAGNRHATFCGSRGRYVAPGYPVEAEWSSYSTTIVRCSISKHSFTSSRCACRSALVSATSGPTSRGNCAIPYTDELIIKVIDTWGDVRRLSGKVISSTLMQLGSWRSLVLAANLWQKVCLWNSALLGTIGPANADLRK